MTSERGKRILLLCTEAYGGRGGIAAFSRDFVTALCDWDKTAAVVAVAGRQEEPVDPGELPDKLTYLPCRREGRLAFVRASLAALRTHGPFDLIFCGHLYLLRTAVLLKWLTRAPLVGIIYGIDAWQPPPRWTLRCALPFLDGFISISAFTTERFLRWSHRPPASGAVLPLCTDLAHFAPKPPRDDLLERYGLRHRKVIMTLARLDARERYKGIDEVIDLMPRLRQTHPALAYLVVGDGSDRERLEHKVREAGLAGHVVFAGYVPEAEKVDHYNLADAFVMCGSGEGFGIVFLEAMACGVPVVASRLDGSREAVLDGKLGLLAHPRNADDLSGAILAALERPKGQVPEGLSFFSEASFRARVHRILDDLGRNRR